MAITNKLITFNKLTSFETQLAQGNILETSIVFIKDAKKIWTKGTYFDCSGGGSNNIAVYETTDDVYNGVLNDNVYELSPILNNGSIYTVVIKQRVKIQTYNIFVFNRCSEIDPGTNYFSCLYTNASEHILYKLSCKITGSVVTLTKQELALKSDISTVNESTVSGWGFTKNTGTVTGVKINGTTKNPSSGVVDLGTVITSHQTLKTINNESIVGSGNVNVGTLTTVATQETVDSVDGFKTINGQSIIGSGNIEISGGGDDITEETVSNWGFTKNTGTITGIYANGTSVATSGVANIPAASTGVYGVTKLSSATNSNSEVLAATPKAVKAAYDLANSYKGTVTGVKINGSTKNPSSGVVDLGTVITDISGKQDKLVSGTNIATINNNSILGSGNFDLATTAQLRDYQPKLVSGTNIKTINGESILGSGNIVVSGGGSTSGSAAYPEINHGTNDTVLTLVPNTFHIWDEVESLQLVYARPTEGIANEYLFQFTSGATATTLMLPDTIKWVGGSAPTIKPNTIYQISILNGLGSVLEFIIPQLVLINFTINGTQYQAADGMTWGEWIESEYNTDGYYDDGYNGISAPEGNYWVVVFEYEYQTLTDLIIENRNYTLER